MSSIFISYRRVDSEGYVGRIYDHLVKKFNKDEIFLDVDEIKPGEDFVARIDQALKEGSALVAVIGPGWRDVRDAKGRRRLDNPRDFVRQEIAMALKRGLLIIPVLVGEAKMPAKDQLPADIAELARHNAVEISHGRFEYDMQRLVTALGGAYGTVTISLVARLENGFALFSNLYRSFSPLGYGTELRVLIDGNMAGKFEKGKDVLCVREKEGTHRISVSSKNNYGGPLSSNPLSFKLKGGEKIFFRAEVKSVLSGRPQLVIEAYKPVAEA
jgi:hypothetical protein